MTAEGEKGNGGGAGLSETEERALYARKRRNAVIFGWILAIVVLITFLGSIMYLARMGTNPFEEPQEEYYQE